MGLALALQVSRQRFESVGLAPARTSLAPYWALVAMLGLDVGRGVQLALEARVENYLLRVGARDGGDDAWISDFAVRGGISIGKLF